MTPGMRFGHSGQHVTLGTEVLCELECSLSTRDSLFRLPASNPSRSPSGSDLVLCPVSSL